MYISVKTKEEEFKTCTYPNIEPNRYSISNHGRIYDLKRKKFKSLKSRDKGGYVRVKLRDVDNKEYNIGVHRLVAYEFVSGYDERKGKTIPNHLDTITDNNYFENLQWVTHSENDKYAVKHGNRNILGEDNNLNIHPESLVIEICNLLESGYTVYKILNYYGVQTHREDKQLYKLINDLRSRKTWSHITQKYTYTEDSTKEYSDSYIREICGHIQQGKTIKEIMNIYGYKKKLDNTRLYNLIWDIKKKRTFTKISKDYNFI